MNYILILIFILINVCLTEQYTAEAASPKKTSKKLNAKAREKKQTASAKKTTKETKPNLKSKDIKPSTFYRGWVYATKDEAIKKIKSLKKNNEVATLQQIELSIAPYVIVTKSFITEEAAMTEAKSHKVSPYGTVFYLGKHWANLGEFYEANTLIVRRQDLVAKGIKGLKTITTEKKQATGYQVKIVETQAIDDFWGRTKKVMSDAHSSGFLQNSAAYTIEDPGHWSKFKNWFMGSLDGTRENYRWKLSARVFYDFAYSLESDLYPKQVKENQQSEFIFDETYIDFSWRSWNFRFGRQHIIWGDLIGSWVGDAVSARDLRDFILPREDLIRIPQWAFMTENFWSQSYLQVFVMPLINVDEFGAFGSDFFPLVIGDYSGLDITEEGREAPRLGDEIGYGFKFDYKKTEAYSLGLFYLHTINREGRYERTITGNQVALKAKHFPISKAGLLASKKFSKYVLRFESAYTFDDRVSTSDLADTDGLVDQPILDFALAIDLNLYDNGQTLLQYVNRTHLDYAKELLIDENQQHITGFADYRFDDEDMSAEITLHFGTQRFDMLLRPRLNWTIDQDWDLSFGYDMFDGDENGIFGRYKNKDRLYSEVRWIF